jgi:hypothetical protein
MDGMLLRFSLTGWDYSYWEAVTAARTDAPGLHGFTAETKFPSSAVIAGATWVPNVAFNDTQYVLDHAAIDGGAWNTGSGPCTDLVVRVYVISRPPGATSTPVRTATSTPVGIVTSTPVRTATTIPVGSATSTPVGIVTSTPVRAVTTIPALAVTPVPTLAVTPVPTLAVRTAPVWGLRAAPVLIPVTGADLAEGQISVARRWTFVSFGSLGLGLALVGLVLGRKPRG